MKILSAAAKAVAMKLIQNSYNKKMAKAQPKAFADACKQANGSFDKNWHQHYNHNLQNNRQKANDSKECWSTFINGL